MKKLLFRCVRCQFVVIAEMATLCTCRKDMPPHPSGWCLLEVPQQEIWQCPDCVLAEEIAEARSKATPASHVVGDVLAVFIEYFGGEDDGES